MDICKVSRYEAVWVTEDFRKRSVLMAAALVHPRLRNLRQAHPLLRRLPHFLVAPQCDLYLVVQVLLLRAQSCLRHELPLLIDGLLETGVDGRPWTLDGGSLLEGTLGDAGQGEGLFIVPFFIASGGVEVTIKGIHYIYKHCLNMVVYG